MTDIENVDLLNALYLEIEALPRYDCDMDGCGDEQCCGSYAERIEARDGRSLDRDEVLSAIILFRERLAVSNG